MLEYIRASTAQAVLAIMLLNEPYTPAVAFPHCNFQTSSPRHRQNYRFHESVPQTSRFSDNNELGFEGNTSFSAPDISQLPAASQSFPLQPLDGQTSLIGFDNVPTIALPRDVQAHQGASYKLSSDALALFGRVNQMNTDSSWLSAGPLTPKSATRFAHQHHRESSLSSLGSAGPASPYSHTTSQPHVAVADSPFDGIHGLPSVDDFSNNYQVATTTKPFLGQEAFYPNYPNYAPASATSHTGYSNNNMGSTRQQANGRSLLPTSGFSHNSQQQQSSNRARPTSVTSSVTDDLPVTPVGEPDDMETRRKNAFHGVPKLDRTMTDIYSDELFNPNFTITSASPAQAHVSPTNEVFAQRLQAANSQHLSAVPSPASSASHGSPFRHGSPLAPAPNHDFSSGTSAHMVFGSSQQLREQRKAAQDAQAMRQQLAQDSNGGTPRTISPKDAVIHTPEEAEADFPLFPKQEDDASFNVSHMDHIPQTTQAFTMPADARAFAYAAAQATANIPTQQYSFLPPVNQSQPQNQPSHLGIAESRQNSADSVQSETSQDATGLQRPMGTTADGGTYTCTYHGCTLRFETPALLQKHKREGHRNAHGITGTRRSESVGLGASAGIGMTPALLNTQAGPHKCERINPSTNKPCNIMFSRPYDLTRHEDTIHNARKQKVRCDLCNEEKTFSRADALTRHYRVCHPHHEVPGKHRRRGGQQHI